MIEVNRVLKKGNAIKRFYPGPTASRMNFYVDATREEDHPGALIIMNGTNNITKKRNQSARELAQEIIEIAYKCRTRGVNKIYIA